MDNGADALHVGWPLRLGPEAGAASLLQAEIARGLGDLDLNPGPAFEACSGSLVRRLDMHLNSAG